MSNIGSDEGPEPRPLKFGPSTGPRKREEIYDKDERRSSEPLEEKDEGSVPPVRTHGRAPAPCARHALVPGTIAAQLPTAPS